MIRNIRISFLTLTLILATGILLAQANPKSLDELINKQNPGWNLVQQWIKEGKNSIQVLERDSLRAANALYQTQVTTRSPMGAIIYETGGIFIDSGWIRILGSGSKQFDRSIMDWNKGKSYNNAGEQPTFLLIADDVLGGFFAINAGGLDKTNIGKVYYFSPDNLSWEKTDMSYSDFLIFCFSGDLNKFYENYRWENWKKDISLLDGTKGMSIYPFLWSKEAQADINKTSKKAVPIQELWDLYFSQAKKQH